jgi:hypothetical protein
MSETVQSEVVKSVSEAGEFECQNHQRMMNEVGVKQQKSNGNGISHTIITSHTDNNNGNNISRETTNGSRAGSHFFPSLLNATLPSKIAIIVGLCQVSGFCLKCQYFCMENMSIVFFSVFL